MPGACRALMVALAPRFAKPGCQHAPVRLVGALLSPGTRTVPHALRSMGKGQDTRVPPEHRVLPRAGWASLAAGPRRLGVLLRPLARDGTMI